MRRTLSGAAGPGGKHADDAQEFLAPDDYCITPPTSPVFWRRVRSRKPVMSDAMFGLRVAGQAPLSNVSHYKRTIYGWDPQAMERK
ncbi:MAG: hypothetical protein ABSG65_21105 [Bryobacteraceae bacterium]